MLRKSLAALLALLTLVSVGAQAAEYGYAIDVRAMKAVEERSGFPLQVTEKKVVVVPTKTVPQGIAAMLSFDPSGTPDQIAEALGVAAVNINAADAAAFDAELLVLGSSTWGVGDLQDDWAAQLDAVKANFAGKKVATFGLGDSVGFADSYCVAAETIANAAKDAGATLVGEILKLDDTNEADQTDSKIAAWVETLKAAL